MPHTSKLIYVGLTMRETKELPSFEYLHQCFSYRDNGTLVWKSRPEFHFSKQWLCLAFNNKQAGKIAGTSQPDGYVVVGLNRKIYKLHRIIYAMHHQDLSTKTYIDHRNGVVFDNRIENLRIASKSENSGNVKIRSDNVSGEKGVWWCKSKCKWIAQVQVNGKKTNKHFDSFEIAKEWVREKRINLHGDFANHGIHKGNN